MSGISNLKTAARHASDEAAWDLSVALKVMQRDEPEPLQVVEISVRRLEQTLKRLVETDPEAAELVLDLVRHRALDAWSLSAEVEKIR